MKEESNLFHVTATADLMTIKCLNVVFIKITSYGSALIFAKLIEYIPIDSILHILFTFQ